MIRLSSFVVVAGWLTALAGTGAAESVVVASPDRKIQAELTDEGGVLRYRILADGNHVLLPSRLGIRCDGAELGKDVVLGTVSLRSVNETYRWFGAHPQAVNRANEAMVAATAKGQAYDVDMHVADDGVGIRLRLPAKPGRKIQADHSTWRLEGNSVVWASAMEGP